MKQNETWLVALDPTQGAEIRKTRPSIIVNGDELGRLPLKIIVPITDWKQQYEVVNWMVHISPDAQNNLSKESAADCFQVRSVSEDRLIRKIGTASSVSMHNIRKALAGIFNIR